VGASNLKRFALQSTSLPELLRLLSPLHLQQGVWRVVRGPAQAALDWRERGEEVWP